MSDGNLMTRAEYARHRGVDKALITRWVKAGKIALDASGRIDAAKADLDLGESRLRLNEPVEAEPAPTLRGSFDPSAGAGLTKARTAVVAYQARRAQLEYERLVGNLVDVKQVAAAATLCADTLVQAVQFAVHAEELTTAAGGTEQVAVRGVLKRIEFDLRQSIAAAFRKMAAEATAKAQGPLAPGAAPGSETQLQ